MSGWDWVSFLIGLAAGVMFMQIAILVGLLMGGAARLRDHHGR
jgi:hypothetical protein